MTASHVFRIWAPEKERVLLHVLSPQDERLEMSREPGLRGEQGYFSLEVHGAGAGTRYAFILEDGKEYPDPASHFQPEGVHGPSEVVDHGAFRWTRDAWTQRPFGEWVIYELHVGAFTPEGTFDAAIGRLDDLADLGINAVEVMPVSQFPGSRNWGYDGVYPFAVQNSYGGPEGLKRFVDACHALEIAVILDVVYNHWGPEGNYAARFAPYFTHEYHTPWGDAVNLDGPWSDGVRAFILDNMRHWFEHYRLDGLRVDAIHAMYDKSAVTLWQEARERLEAWRERLGRNLLLIAESDLNNPRVVADAAQGGFGFHAQWLDDFHHALYVVVHPGGKRHYPDYGGLEQLAKAYVEGFVHSGEWVGFRKRSHGAPSTGIPGDGFVVFNQNHDQIGNRVRGERLSSLVDRDRLKLAAAAMLLSPYVPLLFMGEEYAEDAPFLFFADYGDPEVARGMQEGRRREFAEYDWGGGNPADPLAENTFLGSRLRWEKRETGIHAEMLRWHRDLIALRREAPFRYMEKAGVSAEVTDGRGILLLRRSADGREEAACLFNFSDADLAFGLSPGEWKCVLDSGRAGKLPDEGLSHAERAVSAWTVIVLRRVPAAPR